MRKLRFRPRPSCLGFQTGSNRNPERRTAIRSLRKRNAAPAIEAARAGCVG